MTKTLSSLLLCGAAAAALLTTSAYAETAPADTSATPSDDNPTQVIVTARKRAEVLQDVPLSISAVSDKDLERRNVQDVNDMYAEVPGLYTAPGSVSSTSDLGYLTMRGVGFNAGLEPAVGVFIDGMYQPQIGFDTAFLDLQRVEVLRGPQGTLFGRNTQGGAINMITRKPGPQSHGRLSADFADFGTFRAQGSLDGQIADKLYGGFTAGYSHSDGFVHNSVLDQDQDNYDQSAMRGTLRWVPTEALDIVLMADASKNRYNEVVRGVRLAGNHRESLIDQDKPDSKANHGLQLNITDKISDRLTFTSITGYRYSDSDNFLDMESRPSLGGTEVLPANNPLAPSPVTTHGATLAAQVDQAFTSQEFRLERSGDKLNWLAGVYYFTQEQNQSRQRQAGPHVAAVLPAAFYIYEKFHDLRKGYAAFGQASYRPIEKLELTLGTRISHEKVDGTGIKVSVFGAPLNRAAPIVRDGHPKYDNISWMGSASWKFTPDVLAYATYAQGWKAGGVDRYPGRNIGLEYKPESSGNYEVGVKSNVDDHRITLNLAAYHIDIKNQQMPAVIPDPRGGPVPIPVIDSASRSHVNGVEGEFSIRPMAGLELSSTASYSDGVFDDFVRVFSPTDKFDMAGTSFENVPKVTTSAAVNYTRPLSDGKTIAFFAEYRYIGEIIFQDNPRLSTAHDQLTTPAYDRLNLNVSLMLKSGVKITGYVNNAFNSFDYSYASSDPFKGGDVFVVPLAPRQLGLRISKNF